MLRLLLLGFLFSSVCGEETSTERPAVHFCKFSGNLLSVFSSTLETFKKIHKAAAEDGEAISPFSMGKTKFKFAFATIHDGEVHTPQNIYIGDGSNINCDEKQMNVKLVVGMKDAIVKAKFATPFGIQGSSTLTCKHFEAEVTAVLPRKSNKIEVKRVVVTVIEDPHIELEDKSGIPLPELTHVGNSFLNGTPKGLLYTITAAFVKEFSQQYLDENPLPF